MFPRILVEKGRTKEFLGRKGLEKASGWGERGVLGQRDAAEMGTVIEEGH